MRKNLTVTVTGYYYQKSEEGYIVQGVKRNRTPKRAVSGGNGSFVVSGEPPKVVLMLKLSNETQCTYNIYSIIKDYTSRSRITEKYANEICKHILNQSTLIPYEEGNFINKLETMIESAIDNVG